ncbi:MAG: hypothetical protein BWX57_01094 [Tenericutes bacterium ADurb.Bin024]|jgi:hypothetical protein|nr:MAG: hypothetical protein BWX57_01094 [Tenericutes bacterium ADurb.Bin024]
MNNFNKFSNNITYFLLNKVIKSMINHKGIKKEEDIIIFLF